MLYYDFAWAKFKFNNNFNKKIMNLNFMSFINLEGAVADGQCYGQSYS